MIRRFEDLPMRSCVALLAGALLAQSACSDGDAGSSESESSVESMEVAELEEFVADNVSPDDAGAEVTADCTGGIDVEVDASQDCHLVVGEETADIHFVVTEVEDGEVTEADFTPYVPGDRLAEVVKQQFGQGTMLDEVQCDEELTGEAKATTTCDATAGTQEARIEVEVTEVDGLFVNFHMHVVE